MHRLALGALAGFAVLTGCLKEKVPFCDNGAFCPEPLVCTERTEEPFCGRSGEVEPCMGQPDETACMLPQDVNGFCETGICKVCDVDNAACAYAYDGWVAMTSPVSVDLNAIWVAGPRDVYAAGNGGAVIHWTGRTWAVLPAPAGGGILNAIAGASATDIFAASVSSVFHFDGTAWSGATAAPQAVLGMWGAGPNDFFLAGGAGMTGRFTGTWAYLMPTTNTLNAISGTSSTNVYAVGAATVLHWDGTWTAQPTGTMHILRAVSAAGTRAFAAGRTQAGTPALIEYAGTWTDITGMLPAPVQTASVFMNGVWTNGTHTFVVGAGGTIVHSDGGPWMTMPTNTTVSLTAVGGSGSDVFAVGTGGKVLRYRIP